MHHQIATRNAVKAGDVMDFIQSEQKFLKLPPLWEDNQKHAFLILLRPVQTREAI